MKNFISVLNIFLIAVLMISAHNVGATDEVDFKPARCLKMSGPMGNAGFPQSGSRYRMRVPGTLVGWGTNWYGVTNCPAGNDFVAVAGGDYHSLALRSDGTLIGWGNNSYGEQICPSGSNYVAVSAGYYYSLVLRSDGTLVCWGLNNYGQTNCPNGSNYVAVSAGVYHSIALRNDSTMVSWGFNNYGQCNCPGGSNFVAVAAGYEHSLALRSDGTLTGWGNNGSGRINCPSGTNYVAVSAGADHSLALRSDGTLVSWGNNSYGQCTCPNGSNFVAVAAGHYFSMALCSDGTLVGWGNNTYGKTNCPPGTGYVAIAPSWEHALAIKSNGLFVDITNAPATVTYATTALAIAGTNEGAIGMLWASNGANSLVYAFPAEQAWITPGIALEVGVNPIYVYGTNATGTLVQDGVTITRKAATPTGLSASDGTFTGKVALAWLAAPGASSYAVLRSATNDSGTAEIIATAVSNTVYDDTTSAPGLLYYYWLIARQNGVEGDASAPDSGYRQLLASADIAATLGVYTNNVTISWTAVTGATKYRVYRADSPLSNLATAIAADVTTTNYTDNTATPGLVYYYWAQAESAVALGAWCGPAPGYALLAANFADKKTWAMRDTKKMDTLICKQLPGPWSTLLNGSWGLAVINVSSRAIVSGPFELVTKNGKVYTYKSPTATITYTEHYNKRKGTYKTKLVYKFAGAMPTKPGVFLQRP